MKVLMVQILTHPVTSSLLGPDIVFSTTNILSLPSLIQKQGKIIVIDILTFALLGRI
jgi:hypothetical protein